MPNNTHPIAAIVAWIRERWPRPIRNPKDVEAAVQEWLVVREHYMAHEESLGRASLIDAVCDELLRELADSTRILDALSKIVGELERPVNVSFGVDAWMTEAIAALPDAQVQDDVFLLEGEPPFRIRGAKATIGEHLHVQCQDPSIPMALEDATRFDLRSIPRAPLSVGRAS